MEGGVEIRGNVLDSLPRHLGAHAMLVQEDVTTTIALHIYFNTTDTILTRYRKSPEDWRDCKHVQAGDAEDGRGAVDARRVAGHVQRLHHEEQ
jgi:hypothetical protein